MLKEVQNSSEIALKKEIKAIEERITDISKGRSSDRREEEDKERRRRNVVVFNLPESCANSTAEEWKDDRKVIKTLITERMEMTSQDIINVYRIREKQSGKTRSLLLKTKSEETKWDVIKATRNLRYLKEDNSIPIIVTWDKTKKERE